MKQAVKVIRQADVSPISREQITIWNLLNTKQISFAYIEIDGKNRQFRHLVSDSWYYVLEGTGKFVVDNLDYVVDPGDLIYIPKGAAYFEQGRFKLLSINAPGFDPTTILEITP